MDLFNRKKVKALETKVDILAAANKKNYYSSYNSYDYNGINDFKGFLSDTRFDVSPVMAYNLYDRAAPLSNAVDKIAGAISNLNPMVRTTNDELVENSKILKVLSDVGFGQTYQQFILDYAISYLLTRNAYLITDPFKRTLRTPKAFNVFVQGNNADGYADEYRVTSMNSGNQVTFFRDITNGVWTFVDKFNQELHHAKGQTTNDGLLGRSPIESILVDISQNIQGGNHNLSLLTNGMRSSGVFSAVGELSTNQYDRLQEQVGEKYQGAMNAGRPMFVDGGMTFSEIGRTNKDMDYATVIKFSKVEVASRYNIPLPIISSDHQTLSNFSTAVEAFYDDAVFPIAETLFNAIGNALGIDEGQILTFNKEEIPAIRERRIREAAALHGISIFTDNETRKVLGVEEYDGGNVVYKPTNLIVVGEEDGAEDKGEIVEGAPEADEDDNNDEEKAFKKACMDIGLTKEAAALEWLKLK